MIKFGIDMKKFATFFIIIISLSIMISCNAKKETPPPQKDIISETPIVETEKTNPEQSWKELLLSSNEVSTEEDIEVIKAIIETALENNGLEDLQEYLETEAIKDNVPPQILFGLSLVYGRKGLVKKEYKVIEKLEEQVKQRPGIAFNLSLVYGRKETLKSQIDKAEAEALALLQGFISVTSEPSGAEVFIDGELKGVTPFTSAGLKEGSYSIEVRKEDYINVSQSVTVKAGATTVIKENFVLLPGRLTVNSEPSGSSVLMSGDKIGITPFNIPEIVPGNYILTIAKENYIDEILPITIKPGETKIVTTALVAITGNIYINSLSDGAKVFLDGKKVYPQIGWLKKIPTGYHSLLIQKDNYEEKRFNITIISGKTNYESGNLERIALEIPYAKIRVDGKSGDWDNIEPIYEYVYGSDPFPDDKGTDYKDFKIAHDNRNLYYSIDFYDPPSSTNKIYYYTINIYQTIEGVRHDGDLHNGDIRINHNKQEQSGATFIWENGNFKGTKDTYVRGSTCLEGSIPLNIINFETDNFYISCLLHANNDNFIRSEYVKVILP